MKEKVLLVLDWIMIILLVIMIGSTVINAAEPVIFANAKSSERNIVTDKELIGNLEAMMKNYFEYIMLSEVKEANKCCTYNNKLSEEDYNQIVKDIDIKGDLIRVRANKTNKIAPNVYRCEVVFMGSDKTEYSEVSYSVVMKVRKYKEVFEIYNVQKIA